MNLKTSAILIPQKHLAEAYWRMRLEELGLACRISEAAGQSDGVREAFDLLMLAPPGHYLHLLPQLAEAKLEAMLAAGAYESAALALLPKNAGYMLSQGPNGEHIASVFLPASEQEMTAGGATAALALVAALMAELAEVYPIGVPGSASLN
jgi:hypothetical protein